MFIVILDAGGDLAIVAQTNMVNLMPKYIKGLGMGATRVREHGGLVHGGSALGNVLGGYFGIVSQSAMSLPSFCCSPRFPIYIASRHRLVVWLFVAGSAGRRR